MRLLKTFTRSIVKPVGGRGPGIRIEALARIAMTKGRTNVLVIEDEAPIRRLLRASLSARNFSVMEAETGRSALDLALQHRPDLVILDLGLPDLQGIEVMRRMQEISTAPIVVLSNNSGVRTKVEAFELGATDYITKPFNVEELAARLRVALRNGFRAKGTAAVFRSGELAVDLVRRRVMLGGSDIKLSPTEFAILRLFVTHAGKVLTHDQILREIWRDEKDIEHLRVYIRQLRKKLEPDPQNPQFIRTELGVGYLLFTPD
jgi:two-component system KDP operon response regulator KdpE